MWRSSIDIFYSCRNNIRVSDEIAMQKNIKKSAVIIK